MLYVVLNTVNCRAGALSLPALVASKIRRITVNLV